MLRNQMCLNVNGGKESNGYIKLELSQADSMK